MDVKYVIEKVLTPLLTVLASAATVTAVGGAMLWERFNGAQLPADQAVAVVPKQELVVVGAGALVVFLLSGLLAVGGVYLLDRLGKASTRTRIGLVTLLVAEVGAAIVYGSFSQETAWSLAAAYVGAGVILLLLLEDAAKLLRLPSHQRTLGAVLGRGCRALFCDVGWRARIARGFVILLLGAGAVIGIVAPPHEDVVWIIGVVLLCIGLLCAGWSHGGHAPLLRMLAVAVLGYSAIALIRHARSLAIETAVAATLAAFNLAIAHATGRKFAVYGACVFISVVVFGGALSYLRTRDNPKLQAVAVLMEDTGRTVCGVYVAETDSRLYYGRLDVLDGGPRPIIRPDSGRLLWLPRDQIERSELGPLEAVAIAQRDAVDLRDELTLEHQQAVAANPGVSPMAVQPTATTSTAGTPPSGSDTATTGVTTTPTSASKAPGGTTRAPGSKTTTVATHQPASASSSAAADAASSPDTCFPEPRPVTPHPGYDRDLALKFQPRVIVDRNDKFWPISVLTLFQLRHGKHRTCQQVARYVCVPTTRPGRLPWTGGADEWLDYPAADTNRDVQHDDMVSAIGSRDPTESAREYFLVTGGRARPGIPPTTSIQYWFYYGFNYLEVGRYGPLTTGTAGFHEGDFETVGVLLSAKKRHPVYAWMARHDGEGRPFVFDEPTLQDADRHRTDHVTVFAARGSHASYEACGTQHRHIYRGQIDDHVQCKDKEQLSFEPKVTPLSDLSRAPWVCWRGHFGHAQLTRVFDAWKYIDGDGPQSPLWQQKFGGESADSAFPAELRPCAQGIAPPRRSNAGEEVVPDETARDLSRHAGRLDGLFESCDDWMHAPPRGSYAVACSQRALDNFFASGLERPSSAGVRFQSPDHTEESSGVPAVYRQPGGNDLTDVTLTANRVTIVTLHVACQSDGGRRTLEAEFPNLRLSPKSSRTLTQVGSTWTLTGAGVTITAKRLGKGKLPCDPQPV